MSDRHSVRGYRPSRFAPSDGDGDEREVVRLSNLKCYMMRARAGVPIFEDAGSMALPAAVIADRASANHPTM